MRQIVTCDRMSHLVKSVAPSIIAVHAWDNMGYSLYEDTKNDCSCESTHDQVQQETRHGVSCSHCEAQRQDLLRSRSQLPQSFNHNLSPAQTAELRGCLLGGDRGGRDSLRLDRGSPGEAPLHQGRAKDGSPARVLEMDQLGNLRAGQGRRSEVRCRARYRHRSRKFQSCPRIGQLPTRFTRTWTNLPNEKGASRKP